MIERGEEDFVPERDGRLTSFVTIISCKESVNDVSNLVILHPRIPFGMLI